MSLYPSNHGQAIPSAFGPLASAVTTLHPGSERLLLETYLTRFGLGYLILGYLPPILGIQGEGYKVCWGVSVFLITFLAAWHGSGWLVKQNRERLKKTYSELIGQPEGSVWIAENEQK